MDNSSVIDLFSGAGGLAAGLERAGWRTVAAVDSDATVIESLRAIKSRKLPIVGSGRCAYLQDAKIVDADIANVTARDLRPHGVSPSWRPMLLAGGPPCQPFSSAGKQLGERDPRGTLFLHFVRLTDELRPRFVLFENVRGLVTAKCTDGKPGGILLSIQRQFEKIGYACRFELLNAADYGAPQRRVRLVMLATADYELPEFPEASHAPPESSLLGLLPWVSLRQFLKTQPPPDSLDVVRPKGPKAQALNALAPGTGMRVAGIVEANRPSGHWGYRQDCFLADLEMPSRTIRAASTPDWIREPNGQLRRLTWRECAAIQGFPEGWQFTGSVASRFRQIGNAVEGCTAEALGAALLAHSRYARRDTPQSADWPRHFMRCLTYTTKEHEVNGHLRRNAHGDARCLPLPRRSGLNQS